jgi:hypothetical protein
MPRIAPVNYFLTNVDAFQRRFRAVGGVFSSTFLRGTIPCGPDGMVTSVRMALYEAMLGGDT